MQDTITEQQEQAEFNLILKEPCPTCKCNYCICEDQSQHLEKVEVGTIFNNSWGYDQTNQDFYKVISKTAKSVKVRQLKTILIEKSFMSGTSEPTNEFKDDAQILTKRILHTKDGKAYLRMDYGWCDVWDGKPQSCSWYA